MSRGRGGGAEQQKGISKLAVGGVFAAVIVGGVATCSVIEGNERKANEEAREQRVAAETQRVAALPFASAADASLLIPNLCEYNPGDTIAVVLRDGSDAKINCPEVKGYTEQLRGNSRGPSAGL